MTTMKRNRRRLPIPQYEFGFAVQTFNLMVETTVDGDRIARERDEVDRARAVADASQARLSAQVGKGKHRPLVGKLAASRSPKWTPKELSRIRRNTAK